MRHVIVMAIAAAMLVGCADDAAPGGDGGDTGVRIGDDTGGTGGGGGAGGQADAGGTGGGTGGGTDGGTGSDAGSGGGEVDGGGGTGGDAGGGDPGPCRTALAADRVRKVVVAHPFAEGGEDGRTYEVLELGTDGTLTQLNQTFEMGTGNDTPIAFTPDGEVGFAAQEDGSLGVFRFDASGQVEVLHAALDPGFYVSGVTMEPGGEALWAWETGWRDVGGAIFRIPIDCDDDTLGAATQVAASKLARGLHFLDEGAAVIVADDLLDSTQPDHLHVADLADPAAPQREASVSLFTDDGVVAEGFAVTANGRHALVGDTSVFSGVPNSVSVASIDRSGGSTSLALVQNIEMVDPTTFVASPFDDVVLALRMSEDTITVLDYDPAATLPISVRGELATTPPVLLPQVATMVERGALEGLVLISENGGIRRVRFEGGGQVSDLGVLDFGAGIPQIVGSIGVQP